MKKQKQLKISKDEARVLSDLISEYQADYSHTVYPNDSKEKRLELVNALESLANRLSEYGQDQRRQGRTSQNRYGDCIKRFIKTESDKKNKP